MTLTPSTVRLDLKCGNGAISRGEKCHKGLASAPNADKREVVKKAASVVSAVGLTGLAIAAIINRKKWTEAASDAWRRAKPFEPASPPRGAEYLSQGNNGTIWISKDRKSIIKIPKNKRALIGLDEEVAIQTTLKERGVNTPEIYHYDKSKGVVHMQFMDGYKPLSSALKSAQLDRNTDYARKFVAELKKVHTAGFAHGDLNYNNILIKDGDLAVIDYGFASTASKKGMGDLLNLIRMTKDLDPAYSALLKEELKPIQARISQSKPLVSSDFANYYERVQKRDTTRGDTVITRFDLKCGKGAISQGEKCTKGPSTQAKIAAGIGLTAGALALGALATRRKPSGTRPTRSTAPEIGATPTRPSGPPRLPGSTPRALLAPAPPRQSKTQRMRANTSAAVRKAEGAIAQTAREEVRRLAQIGNTMAATGEATGMAVKTGLRELRLRTEAARRRYEPGYRSPDQRRLPGGVQAALPQLTPERETIPIDPRTGQPRRRKAQGFGRRDNYIQYYAPVQLQPPNHR